MKTFAIAVALTIMGLAGACTEGDGEPAAEPIRWEASGVCGEAFFWAASSDGRRAVTVSVGTFRASDEPATMSFSLPDDLVSVLVVEGTHLDRYYCTDLPASGSAAASMRQVTTGSGEIVLGGRGLCYEVPGRLTAEGLRTPDGVEYPPVEINALGVGCYSG